MIKDIDGIHYYILGDKKNAEPATQSVKIAFRISSVGGRFAKTRTYSNTSNRIYKFHYTLLRRRGELHKLHKLNRQLSKYYLILLKALKLSEFVDFDEDARTVKIIDLPTIKFRDQAILLAFETTLKQFIDKKFHNDNPKTVKPLQYIVSNKTDDGFYYVVLKSKQPADKQGFQQLVGKIGQGSSFLAEPLYEQLKEAHSKLRKSKRENQQREHLHNNNYSNRNESNNYNNLNAQQMELSNPVYSRNNMMHPWMYYPMYGTSADQMQIYASQTPVKSYGIFIRKAVDSDDEPEQAVEQCTQKSNKNNNIQNPPPQQTQIQPNKKQQQKHSQKPSKQHQQQQLAQSAKHKKDEKQSTVNNNGNKQNKGKIVLDDNDFPTIG